jgi:hypothetical protein
MRTLLLTLLAGCFLVVPGAPAHATSCAPPAYPAADGSFNPVVKASHVSCAKAGKVMLQHYQCRTEAGPMGRCVHRVKRYACQEERYSDFYAPDYVATVTCKHGRKKVVFGYSQTKYDS